MPNLWNLTRYWPFGEATTTTAAAGVASGIGVPTAATTMLSYLGFTSEGVKAMSIAATWQSAIGNVVADSSFAYFQSTGALGGFAIAGPLGLTAALVGTAGTAYYFHLRR